MILHRMVQIPSPPGDPRPRYRGTGFNTQPGGLTWIGDETLGWWAKIFRWGWQ